MKLSPDHKRSDFKIKSIRIIQPDLQAKEIQIIDVKEIYDRRRYNISREALQKLTESFEDHAKSLEGRTKQQDQSAQMLEDAIRRSSVWKNSSQRAQQFLAAQDKKKENPENLPEHFSENVIKAGAMFRDKFVRKEVWKAYPFDEKMLTGFHCYDVDFSLQIAVSKRYRNYVCCSPEVQVEHLSEGNYNRNWCQDTVRMYNRKWNVILTIKIDDLCLTKREMERYREKSFNRFLQKSFKVDFPEKKEVLMAFLSYPFSLEHLLHCISGVYRYLVGKDS